MCKRFDVMIMKPIFIRKYKYSVARQKDEFYELFLQDTDQWEEFFISQQKANANTNTRFNTQVSAMKQLANMSK